MEKRTKFILKGICFPIFTILFFLSMLVGSFYTKEDALICGCFLLLGFFLFLSIRDIKSLLKLETYLDFLKEKHEKMNKKKELLKEINDFEKLLK